jgi:hypothetical protein
MPEDRQKRLSKAVLRVLPQQVATVPAAVA